MSRVDMGSGFPVGRDDKHSLVVIDPRILFRESLVLQFQGAVDASDVLGVCTVDQWRQVAPGRAPASVIVVAAVHRSIAQMEGELDALAAVSPGVPIVLLSEIEDYHQVSEALRRGLSGFIPMTSSVKVAQSALALVLAGGCFVPSGIVCTRAVPQAAEGAAHGSIRLTEREVAVLGALQIGKPNKVIAHELSMCTNTVKVHVRNIMKKLQARNRTELAYLVNTRGVVSWGHRLGGAWFHPLSSVEHGPVLKPLAASPPL